MATTGFFVDWNGDVRSLARIGGGYTHGPVTTHGNGSDTYQAVDILDADGLVIFEGTYYPSLDAIKATGVSINMAE